MKKRYAIVEEMLDDDGRIISQKHTGREVIECKDCKAYLPETKTLASHCPVLKIYGLPEDAYCYKAQRRKNDNTK